jgi:hypothetical protein
MTMRLRPAQRVAAFPRLVCQDVADLELPRDRKLKCGQARDRRDGSAGFFQLRVIASRLQISKVQGGPNIDEKEFRRCA